MDVKMTAVVAAISAGFGVNKHQLPYVKRAVKEGYLEPWHYYTVTRKGEQLLHGK